VSSIITVGPTSTSPKDACPRLLQHARATNAAAEAKRGNPAAAQAEKASSGVDKDNDGD
jgi:hypothetical protein